MPGGGGRFGPNYDGPSDAELRAINARREAELWLSPTFLPSISPERRAQLVELLSAEFAQATSSIRGHAQTATPWKPRLLTPAEQREHLIQGQKGRDRGFVGNLVSGFFGGASFGVTTAVQAADAEDRRERLDASPSAITRQETDTAARERAEFLAAIAPPQNGPTLLRLERPLPPGSTPAGQPEMSGPPLVALIAVALVAAFLFLR